MVGAGNIDRQRKQYWRRRIIYAAAVLLPGACILRPQSQPVFRGSTRLVTVPAAVKDAAARFVRNLAPDDFRLFDNDRPQRFQLDYIDEPVALAVVVQTNDAVRAWLPHVKRAASMVETLVAGANGQTLMIQFAGSVTLAQPWTRSTQAIDAAFAALKPSLDDESPALDAVSLAASELGKLPVRYRRVIVLIAQSGDIGSEAKLPDVLSRIEMDNIIVYNLAMPHIGKDVTRKSVRIGSPSGVFAGKDTGIMGTVELAKLVPEIYRDAATTEGRDPVSILCAESGGIRTPFRHQRDFESGLASIAEELHTEYVLAYTPDSADPGYHRIRVEIVRPELSVRARPGYFNPR